MVMKRLLNKNVEIIWTDSYGVESGWQDISEYTAKKLIVHSFGKIIYENADIISLAHNYAEETDKTTKQANGIMVIPKACIIKVISFSCQGPVLIQKRLMS
jgi:type III secretory pathway lipoprotein EscJ